METEEAVFSEVPEDTNKEICLVEEPPQENDQKVPEIHLQEDEMANECDSEDPKDKTTGTKVLLKASQEEKRSIKEDFSQFKAEVLKMFREKDTNQSNQAGSKPAPSVLNIMKEDLSQFKEDMTSVFGSSKETKSTDPKTSPSNQAENKLAPSMIDIMKEDLSQFKEDMTSVFGSSKETKSTDPNNSQSAEKTINRFLNFKDDLSNVFKISLSKERDNKGVTAKEDSSNTFKSKAKRTDEPFLQSLFRRDQNTSQKAENSQEVKTTLSETSEKQMHAGFRGNLSEQNDETVNSQKIHDGISDRMDTVEDSEVDRIVSEETTTGLSETQQTEETIPTSVAAEQRWEELSEDSSVVSAEQQINNREEEEKEEQQQKEKQEEEQEKEKQEEEQEKEKQEEEQEKEKQEEEQEKEKQEEEQEKEKQEEEQEKEKQEEEQENEKQEEDKSSETLPWEPLIDLFSLRNTNKDDIRGQPGGDLWSVKNFACYLTLDPNTANSELHLTDGNRKATRVWSDHRPSDHPERFERCPQLLCREGLLDSVYWEVMWSGGADIGVTYNSISRDGDTASCLLGHNERSWSLECSEGSYTPCHSNKRFRSSSPRPFTHRVGVYLNWSAGSLSFYCVSHDTMVHLHTFNSTFTEPLYPGFWVWAYDGSVLLSQVELDWERLLQ